VVGPYEHGNEPSGSIKDQVLLDYLNDCQLLNKDCAQWSQSVSQFEI